MLLLLFMQCWSAAVELFGQEISSALLDRLTLVAKFAALPYCKNEAIYSRSCKSCHVKRIENLENVKISINQTTALKWLTAYDAPSNTIVVSFRGSYNKQNWMDNLKQYPRAPLVPIQPLTKKQPMVERGWYTSLQGVTFQLKRDIHRMTLLYPKAQLLFTGQSSGASYATLAAYLGLRPGGFLKSFGVLPSQVNLITFGSPKIGNSAFVTEFQQLGLASSFRVTKESDVISYIPLSILGYHHIGREVIIHQDKAYLCPKETCISTGVASLLQQLQQHYKEISDIHLHYLGQPYGAEACV